MMPLFPILIAIITIVIVMFIARDQRRWTELSSSEKQMRAVLLAVGIILLLAGILTFILRAFRI